MSPHIDRSLEHGHAWHASSSCYLQANWLCVCCCQRIKCIFCDGTSSVITAEDSAIASSSMVLGVLLPLQAVLQVTIFCHGIWRLAAVQMHTTPSPVPTPSPCVVCICTASRHQHACIHVKPYKAGVEVAPDQLMTEASRSSCCSHRLSCSPLLSQCQW